MPRHWKSSDHQAIVWCRRLQLSITRTLFNLQRNNSFDLDTSKYRGMFDHWLSTPSPKVESNIYTFPHIIVDSKWTWLVQKDHNRDIFFNFMENNTITVITCLVVTRYLKYRFFLVFDIQKKKSFNGVDFVAYTLSNWSHRWQMVTAASNLVCLKSCPPTHTHTHAPPNTHTTVCGITLLISPLALILTCSIS